MQEPQAESAQIRITTIHLIALLLGLAGTGLTLLQARYGLTHPARGWLLILIACVPLIAAIAFAIGPRHGSDGHSPYRAVRSWSVWGNLGLPVGLTVLTLILVAGSGNFEHFAGFAMLLAANAGRNLRDLIHYLL